MSKYANDEELDASTLQLLAKEAASAAVGESTSSTVPPSLNQPLPKDTQTLGQNSTHIYAYSSKNASSHTDPQPCEYSACCNSIGEGELFVDSGSPDAMDEETRAQSLFPPKTQRAAEKKQGNAVMLGTHQQGWSQHQSHDPPTNDTGFLSHSNTHLQPPPQQEVLQPTIRLHPSLQTKMFHSSSSSQPQVPQLPQVADSALPSLPQVSGFAGAMGDLVMISSPRVTTVPVQPDQAPDDTSMSLLAHLQPMDFVSMVAESINHHNREASCAPPSLTKPATQSQPHGPPTPIDVVQCRHQGQEQEFALHQGNSFDRHANCFGITNTNDGHMRSLEQNDRSLAASSSSFVAPTASVIDTYESLLLLTNSEDPEQSQPPPGDSSPLSCRR